MVDRHGQERRCGAGKAGEKAARRWQARLEAAEWAERRGEPIDSVLGASWTLKELKERDLSATAGKASWPSRRRRWEALLEAFGETTPLDRLTPAVIQAFVAERSRAVTAQTIRNDLSLLSSALKFARRMRHASGFAGNPLLEIERPTVKDAKETRAEDDETVQNLIRRAWKKAAAAPPHLRELWRDNAAIIELAYLTSSRISQVLTLRREQVKGGVLYFPPQKLGLPRDFPVSGRIGAVLRKLPDRGIYFFPARLGAVKKAHRDNLRRFWRDVAPEGFTLHGLRHSSITAALEAGESPTDAARRGGWKSLAMLVRTYGHIYRRPIGPLPRAGNRTANNSGRPRRMNATKRSKNGKKGKPRKGTPVNSDRVFPASSGRESFS